MIESPIRTAADVEALSVPDPRESVPFILEAVGLVRAELEPERALIGFCGGPFTVAGYVVEGRPTRDFVQPPGVVVQRIDKATGLLAPAGQDANTLDEVFLDGTVPTEQAPPAGQEQSADKLLME